MPLCSVSILVLMDSSLQSPYNIGFNARLKVSILVLMDSSLQSAIALPVKDTDVCFNPCFNGFFSSIARLIDVLNEVSKFQSLF